MREKMLLHVCCAPCASSVLERLLAEAEYDITIYFTNSNILPYEEYNKRIEALEKLKKELYPSINIVYDKYIPDEYFAAIKGLETAGEGSKRCERCIYYRLEKTAEYAQNNGFDIFATTLTVSPHKNANMINSIGKELETIKGVKYLESDFKKKNGYLRSIQICKEHDIYRQTYCGCNL